MQRIRSFTVLFLKADHGVALIEFALVFPALMLMLLGSFEVGRAIVITQRVEKSAYVIADITSQFPPATASRSNGEINQSQLTSNVFPQLNRIMGTYGDASQQAAILTSVRKESGQIKIKWQSAGGGSLTAGVNSVVNGLAPSAIGPAVKNTTAAFTEADVNQQLVGMADKENMIIAEVFYKYNPVWNQVVGAITTSPTGPTATIASPRLLIKRMYFRPRNGNLTCLPELFVYPVATDSTGC